jgi:hypothetical protein
MISFFHLGKAYSDDHAMVAEELLDISVRLPHGYNSPGKLRDISPIRDQRYSRCSGKTETRSIIDFVP